MPWQPILIIYLCLVPGLVTKSQTQPCSKGAFSSDAVNIDATWGTSVEYHSQECDIVPKPVEIQVTFELSDFECRNPRISFTFHEIDFDLGGEYIDIYQGVDAASGTRIKRCGENGADNYGSVGGGCGTQDTCLSQVPLPLEIGAAESVNLVVWVSGAVDGKVITGEECNALCSDQSLLNQAIHTDAVLALTCQPPTLAPTTEPTTDPTAGPTRGPTADPTTDPSVDPTTEPTTAEPTMEPTTNPTRGPTAHPTIDPTTEPTRGPTADPTSGPTIDGCEFTYEEYLDNCEIEQGIFLACSL